MKPFRMSQWLLFSVMLYGAAIALRQFLGLTSPYAPIETAMWKLGNVSVAAYVGYFIDRQVFPCHRIVTDTIPLDRIRRAIIMAAAMMAVSLGL